MTESDLHKFIKNKIAEALTELGFETKTEVKFSKGILDISAIRNGEHIKVEVIRTHRPDWVLCEVEQEILSTDSNQQLIFESNVVNFGVTFPKKLLAKLDQIRGDVPRSVFLQRLVEEKVN